jgi:uncharacterized membrane protein
MPDPATTTPIRSTKGILALSIIWTYAGIWAYVVYEGLNKWTAATTENPFDLGGFLLEFAGASSVMGMIVLLVVQNFFRKTEAQ